MKKMLKVSLLDGFPQKKDQSDVSQVKLFIMTVKCLLEVQNTNNSEYSPAAIIRNAKIWNIILSYAFFQTLGSNLDLENPAVSEENCLEDLLPLP